MRPESIRRFDMFYLGSIALSVVDYFIERNAVLASVEAQSQAARLSLGAGFVDGAFAFWTALMLLLWYLAAHRRSTVAKWLIVLIVVISLFGVPGLVTGAFTGAKVISLLSFLLSWIAVYFLFRSDAKAWFAGTAAETPEQAATDD